MIPLVSPERSSSAIRMPLAALLIARCRAASYTLEKPELCDRLPQKSPARRRVPYVPYTAIRSALEPAPAGLSGRGNAAALEPAMIPSALALCALLLLAGVAAAQ